MTLPAAVGLSGFAGAGKSTAAEFLAFDYDYKTIDPAEPFKNMLRALLREYQMPPEQIERYVVGDLKNARIDVIGRTSRELRISLGTGWGQKLVHPTIWTDIWLAKACTRQRPMAESLRYRSEEKALRMLGGVLIEIRRPGVGPAVWRWPVIGRLLYRWFGCLWGADDSERPDRLHPDYIIHNTGSQDALREMVERVVIQAAFDHHERQHPIHIHPITFN